MSHVDLGGSTHTGDRVKYTDSEVRACLTCSRKGKRTNMAGAEQAGNESGEEMGGGEEDCV